MSNVHELKFERKAPSVLRDKPIDWTLIYPIPTEDSPVTLTPLSIMYPGAMLEAEGKRVAYVDLRWDDWDMMEQLIKDSANVGVSAFTGKQCARAAEILERVKQIDKRIVTHVGGHHARLCPEDVAAEPNVDVVWKEKSYGEDLFPFSEGAQRLWKRGEMQYITSTGCPYGCTFCALRSAWTPRPIEKIEQEITAIQELTGFTELSLTDPNMGFDRTRVNGVNQKVDRVERLTAIGKIFRDRGIRYDCNLRADYITPEVVDAMAGGGCFSVEFGAESGNDEFLQKHIRKGHGTQAVLDANKYMHGSGISVMNSFVRGMPKETHDQWLDTMQHIDTIMEIAPEARASVYKFTPYPGGPAFDLACAGIGIEKFNPPKTMKEWGNMPLMVDSTYWVTGLCFRLDNTRKNFPPQDWHLIEPYVLEARRLWKGRRPEEFKHVAEVERLIQFQIRKHNAQKAA